jgi:uncharacterized phage-associated protein
MFVDGFRAESYMDGMTERATMVRDGAHDPRAIANKMLDIRAESGQPLTVMQLIKLVYIADGWSIALHERPLSKQNPQAWQYGPVYPTVYTAFKQFGSKPITAHACVKGTDVPYIEQFTAEEEELLRAVVASYGKLSAFALSNLTHQAGTPWSEAYAKGAYSEIGIEAMREHFQELKGRRLVAAA